LKKSLTILLLLLLSISFTGILFPLEIKEVRIQGNKNVSTQKILLLLKSRPQTKYDKELLKDDIRRLGETGYFSDISYTEEEKGGEIFITINLKEKPVIEKITFNGNRKIKTKHLKKYIGIGKGEIFNEVKLMDGINEIKKTYEEKGFLWANITYETEQKKDKVFLNVNISENQKAYVGKIIFEENRHFSSSKLRKLMKVKQRKMPFLRGTFKPDTFKKDIKNIERFYQKNGFLDVKFTEKSISFKKRRLTLKLVISEGKQYFLGEISFKGNLVFDEKNLRDVLPFKKNGEVFNEEKAEENLRNIKQLYFDKGYIKTIVEVFPEQGSSEKIINITYFINPGNVFYIEEIKIKGNTKTKDKVLRRELKLFPGDIFSGEKVTKSFNNLRDLNYFENINIYPEFTEEPDRADLTVEVKEKEKTGILMFGGGYSSIDKIVGVVSLEQTNFDIKNPPGFTGGGQDLKLWVQIGSETTGYNLSFTEPYFLDKPIWLGVDLYSFDRDWDEYTEKKIGGDIRVGRRWEKFSLGFKIKSESVKLSDITIPDSSIQSQEGTHRKNSFTTTFNFINLDSRTFPEKGHKTTLEMEYAGGIFQGDIDFIKLILEEHLYYPIKKFTFHSKTYFGIIKKMGDTDTIPIYEKFFGGGIGSVRGYEERSLGPKIGDYFIGGNTIFAQNFELFYPIYKKILKGLIFFDIGNVWEKWGDFNDLKKGVGAGLRIQTPLFSAPIQLDYGIALDAETGEERGRLHIGMSFVF